MCEVILEAQALARLSKFRIFLQLALIHPLLNGQELGIDSSCMVHLDLVSLADRLLWVEISRRARLIETSNVV